METKSEAEEDSLKEYDNRIQIRQALKAQYEINQSNKEELTNIDSSRLRSSIEDCHKIGKGHLHIREQSLCAKVEGFIAKSAKIQAQRIGQYDSKLDFGWLASCVRNRHGKNDQPTSLDWEAFGSLAMTLFDCAAELVTLRGPMLLEAKVRQNARRQPNPEGGRAELVKAEVLTMEDNAEDEATSQRITTMINALDEIQRLPGAEDGFDLLSLLVHPEHPIQTIENFFDFSFIIKQKQAAMDLDDEGLPLAVLTAANGLENESKQQMVLSMPMRSIRALTRELYRTTTANPLNARLDRPDDLYKIRSPHDQVLYLQRQAALAAESRKRKRGSSPPAARGEIA